MSTKEAVGVWSVFRANQEKKRGKRRNLEVNFIFEIHAELLDEGEKNVVANDCLISLGVLLKDLARVSRPAEVKDDLEVGGDQGLSTK